LCDNQEFTYQGLTKDEASRIVHDGVLRLNIRAYRGTEVRTESQCSLGTHGWSRRFLSPLRPPAVTTSTSSTGSYALHQSGLLINAACLVRISVEFRACWSGGGGVASWQGDGTCVRKFPRESGKVRQDWPPGLFLAAQGLL